MCEKQHNIILQKMSSHVRICVPMSLGCSQETAKKKKYWALVKHLLSLMMILEFVAMVSTCRGSCGHVCLSNLDPLVETSYFQGIFLNIFDN